MKTVLITGASRGIGAEIARVFAKNGYKVVVNYNQSKAQAEELVKEITEAGGQAIAIQADVSVHSDVKAMWQALPPEYRKIDVLINNAGISQQKMFADITERDWDKMFDVTVKGAYNCLQMALPVMVNEKWGRIINISSMWGQVGASCEVHYSAAKGAIIAMTKALAKEMGLSGITVNCIAPGVIDTEMNSLLDEDTLGHLAAATPMGRLGTPADVAQAALWLADEKADFITGQVIGVNGGFII